MKFMSLATAYGCLLLPAFAMANLQLVDEFSTGELSASVWSDYYGDPGQTGQFDGYVDAVQQQLVMTAISTDGSISSFGSELRNTTLTGLAADITVVQVDDGGTEAHANISGIYYNAGSMNPTDATGDVFASVRLGDRGNGLEAWWIIVTSTQGDFETFDLESGTLIGPGVLSLNTAYTASVQYDGNRAFTFELNGVSSGPQQADERMGEAYDGLQRVAVHAWRNGDAPSVTATVDNVYADGVGVPYDTFDTGPHLDDTLWVHHGARRLIENGELRLGLHKNNIDGGDYASASVNLINRNPDTVQVDFSLSSDTSLDAGLQGLVELEGYLYNSRRGDALPYDSTDGDVYGKVYIESVDGVLSAYARLVENGVDYSSGPELLYEPFSTSINFDTPYTVSIARENGDVVFGLNDETIRYTITTAAYAPSPDTGDGMRRVRTSLYSLEPNDTFGKTGQIEALVDNVFVDATVSGIESDSTSNSSGGGVLHPFFLLAAVFGRVMVVRRQRGAPRPVCV